MISVGIPVYFPDPAYLKQVLDGIVPQLNRVPESEIFIYDDSGAPTDVAAWLSAWGLTGRVAYEAGSSNLGLAGAWNACIGRTSQPLVHILHQDDLVLDGFYEAVLDAFNKAPEAGAVLNRTLYVDGDGTWNTFSIRAAPTDGVIPDFNRLVFDLDIQCPSMVVRRRVYETVGLFDGTLLYQLDREFWTRMSVHFPVYYLRQPRTCFRIHENQRSTVLKRSRITLIELSETIEKLLVYAPPAHKEEIAERLEYRCFQGACSVLEEDTAFEPAWRLFHRGRLRWRAAFLAHHPALALKALRHLAGI